MNAVIQSLKQATQQLHSEVEQFAYANEIRLGKLTLAMYEDLIEKTYHIHSFLEKVLLQAAPIVGSTPLYQQYSSKLELLEKDGKILKLALHASNFDHFLLPDITSEAQLAGLLYVVEGSMLGGQIIHEALRKNEQLNHLPELYFFAGNKGDTGQHWRKFAALVEAAVQSEEQQRQANETARKTFQVYCDVYSQTVS